MTKKKDSPPPADEPEIEILVNPTEHVLGGGIRGEVYGCPTGLSRPTPVPRKEKEEGDEPSSTPKGEPRQG